MGAGGGKKDNILSPEPGAEWDACRGQITMGSLYSHIPDLWIRLLAHIDLQAQIGTRGASTVMCGRPEWGKL